MTTHPITRPLALAAALVACALGAFASSAAASLNQESIVMDDNLLVYGSAEGVEARMAELKALGADTVRVSVFWRVVAPSSDSRERPSFGSAGAASPAGYPASRWERYDRVVAAARKHGIRVLFNLTSPVPAWATGKAEDGLREDVSEPSADDFKDFATAVGARYSGSYAKETPAKKQPGLFDPPPPPDPPAEIIPKVDYWSIWNEPNFPSWLGPQRRPSSSKRIPPAESSRLYRKLADAMYGGLVNSGHGSDQILLGETAPRGFRRREPQFAVPPLEFVRELYCLDSNRRMFKGFDAERRGCPTDGAARSRFVSDHPVLFRASGWAHHPYYLDGPPDASDVDTDNAPLGDIERLIKTLESAQRVWRQGKRYRIFITEFGYQTDPPDPIIGVSWARQAAYLNRSDHIAARNPRIASMAQFLLVDDGPRNEFASNDPRHFGNFQSGLITSEGKRKDAYAAYQLPIDVYPPRQVRGSRFAIFAQQRGAPNGAQLVADLQFQGAPGAAFKSVASQNVSTLRGIAQFSVPAQRKGAFRVVWSGSGTKIARTRTVKVTVAKAARKPAAVEGPAR